MPYPQGPGRDDELSHGEPAHRHGAPRLREGRVPDFYHAMFGEQVKKEDMRAVFTEYAWDMGWCDPCAADRSRPTS